MDRQKIRAMRADMEEALKAVGEKYGVSFKCGNASFGDTYAIIKVEAAENMCGIPMTKEVKTFVQDGAYMGFKPEHLEVEFVLAGKPSRIMGMTERGKYRMLVSQNGKTYKYMIDSVKKALASQGKL